MRRRTMVNQRCLDESNGWVGSSVMIKKEMHLVQKYISRDEWATSSLNDEWSKLHFKGTAHHPSTIRLEIVKDQRDETYSECSWWISFQKSFDFRASHIFGHHFLMHDVRHTFVHNVRHTFMQNVGQHTSFVVLRYVL